MFTQYTLLCYDLIMKTQLTLSLFMETSIVLDALATLLQKPQSGVVELIVQSYLASLPNPQKKAIETIRAAAVANIEASHARNDRTAPSATYHSSRLRFRRDIIESIAESEEFRVITPNGTFQMTKADFYREFSNVVESRSYREIGSYNYQKLPARAERYRVS
jgi:hypothetical protein